jgi:NAD(P)-dependent dehydrogenase (short-subunit alcohol dehydrogenase family)
MDPISLEGKVAIIAGASRGMGREIAVAYAAAGAKGVVVTAAPAGDESKDAIDAELADTVAAIDAAGGEGTGLGLIADVTDWSDCQNVVARTVETFGTVHVLYHNAGKSQRYHGARDIPFWETEPEGWREVITTNVVGPYMMAKAAIPTMLEQGWGRIIVTNKNADSQHERFAGAYGPSKSAVEAQVLSWAEETAGTGVTVNCLGPGGAVNTRFGRGDIRDRGLPPDVMNKMALWLASDDSADFNGCRFTGKYWDDSLANAEAAEKCRDAPLFPVPASKPTKLTHAWRDSERATAGTQTEG